MSELPAVNLIERVATAVHGNVEKSPVGAETPEAPADRQM